jgi:hypothetical protein
LAERFGKARHQSNRVVISTLERDARERSVIRLGRLAEKRRLAITYWGEDRHHRLATVSREPVHKRSPPDQIRVQDRRLVPLRRPSPDPSELP